MSRFSRSRKRQQSGHEQAPLPASGLRPIDVHVPTDESATVGGLPVAVGSSESVEEAVLNYLHRLVLATGHPVSATVHDERIGYITPIQVSADGSSAFAGQPVPLVAGATSAIPLAHALAVPEAAAHEDPHTPAAMAVPALQRHEEAEGTSRAVPDPVGEETASAPEAASPVRSAQDAPSSASAAPSLLAEPVQRINEAVSRGRIESAAAMAEQSIASASQTLGPEHPEVLQLRELAAYIAYLAGDARRSFTLSMDLARARLRQGDERAVAGVQSAAAAWRALRDPAQGLDLGRELIALWDELATGGGPAAADRAQLEAARARMGRLAERVRTAPH
ncbi:hypothetical protein ABZ858_19195 [Streptomyces sp. NPDC047017]|uniref:hypothetical protein n=1 Tax=Streptomyces sp. NPDC047017 TaxID=3155024 RepID=UPI0033F8B904